MLTPARHSAAVRLRRIVTTSLAGAFAASLAITGVLIPAAPATAAEISGAITSVSIEKATYGYDESITLSFDWSVPDTVVAGDTFSLDLPPELEADNLAKFSLLAPDGSTVALAEWNGTSVVFTLADFVNGHDNVGGSGFVSVRWNHSNVPETAAPITLVIEGKVIVVEIEDMPTPPAPCTDDCPAPDPIRVERGLWKSGGWTDGAFQGTKGEDHNLYWGIGLPGSADGYVGPITVIDTPSFGSVIECATMEVWTQYSLDPSAVESRMDASRYSLDCSPSTFTLVLDVIAPHEFVEIWYEGTITDQTSGVYGNRVEVSLPSGESAEDEHDMKRTSGGGIGSGVQSVSVAEYVWLDSNGDGIQDAEEQGIPGVTLLLTGPDGTPVLDAAENLVEPAVTDENGKYLFGDLPVLESGQSYTVWIDYKASDAALNTLIPTVPSAGTDRAKDSSTDFAVSTDLTTNRAQDHTLDFGFVAPGAVSSELAFTGANSALPLVTGALALIMLGTTSLFLVRLRRV